MAKFYKEAKNEMKEDVILLELETLSKTVNRLDRKLEIKMNQVHTQMNNDKDKILEKMDAHNAEHTEDRRDYGVQINKKLSVKMFMWITGFIILGLISLSTYASINGADIKKLETHIEHIEKEDNN